MNTERKVSLIIALYPNADKHHRKALRKLADEKQINWYAENISSTLYRLMCSIIRYRDTHYDECIKQCGQDKARFYIQGEINRLMNHFRGIKTC